MSTSGTEPLEELDGLFRLESTIGFVKTGNTILKLGVLRNNSSRSPGTDVILAMPAEALVG